MKNTAAAAAAGAAVLPRPALSVNTVAEVTKDNQREHCKCAQLCGCKIAAFGKLDNHFVVFVRNFILEVTREGELYVSQEDGKELGDGRCLNMIPRSRMILTTAAYQTNEFFVFSVMMIFFVSQSKTEKENIEHISGLAVRMDLLYFQVKMAVSIFLKKQI